MQSQWPTVDELIRLNTENPDELEALRQREIERLICAASHHSQKRLRGLQFQIDARRNTSRTSMSACLVISRMMMDSFHELNDALNNAKNGDYSAPASNSADIIAFPNKRQHEAIQ